MNNLKEKEIWEKMIRISPDVVCMVNGDGIIIDANEAYAHVIGYESEELIGRHFRAFVHPDDFAYTIEIVQDVIKGIRESSFENRNINKSGGEVHFIWSGVWSDEEEVLFCIGRDVTEQRLLRKKLQEKDEFYRALVEHGSDIISLFDEDLNYLFCGSSILRELGYKQEQLIGSNALSFIHSDDIPLIKQSLSEGLVSGEMIEISEFRFKDAGGEWRWLSARGSNQLQNPSIKAVMVSSRDITQEVDKRRKLQESDQRFKALFEGNPDLVTLVSKEGVIMDANPAFVSYFEMEKHEVENRPLNDFLPLETSPDSSDGRLGALKGKQVCFEVKVKLTGHGKRVMDVKKIPVTVNNETIGNYIIAKDVTASKKYQKIIKRQAKKLSTIFESITDAFFTLDKKGNFTYINNECERLLKRDRKQLIGEYIWEIFPNEVNEEFYHQLNIAFHTGKAVHFETFLNRIEKWLQVKAFPSKKGLSVYFDDITERVRSKQELEKLSLVASKTINGVVILDPEGQTEWINEGFTKTTGYTPSEIVGKYPGSILAGEETDPATESKIREGLMQDKPFTEEVLSYKKSGEKIWLSLDFTPILNEAGEVTNFIVLETDITFRKKAEASQLQLTKDLYKRNSDLQQFSYIVSHNLFSPIAGAMGLVDLLTTTDKNSADFDKSLDYLKGSIYKINTVLKDLSTVLSARDNKETSKERIELASVCQKVIEEQQESLIECGGEVSLDFEERVSVQGNRAYLYSIFHNLLSNAIKYRSPERALKVNVRCFNKKDGGVIISFSDNGSGFDMELVGENLFRLYKRFHGNTEGRGIGMFLVKSHVEAMDGHIEVESQVNKGTTFLIYLK